MASSKVEGELNGKGRLLLRYSGTENLARVMIEGKDKASIESQARRLADVIRSRDRLSCNERNKVTIDLQHSADRL